MNAHSPTATDTLQQAVAQYEGDLVFATSFGAEDQVLTHMISHLGLNIPLATLDTGRLFREPMNSGQERRKHTAFALFLIFRQRKKWKA